MRVQFRELLREWPFYSRDRKWCRQTGSRQSTPLSTIRTRYGNSVSTPEATRGKLFYLQLELFCLQFSFFAYGPLRPLLDALSHCEQKAPTVSKKAKTVSEKAPTVSKKAKIVNCKQRSSTVSRKLPTVSKKAASNCHTDWQNPAEFSSKRRPIRNFSIKPTSSIRTSIADAIFADAISETPIYFESVFSNWGGSQASEFGCDPKSQRKPLRIASVVDKTERESKPLQGVANSTCAIRIERIIDRGAAGKPRKWNTWRFVGAGVGLKCGQIFLDF